MIVKKPPMGYNTWNTFGEKINEQLILEIADVMVAEGYKDAGYEYLVIDDCWSEPRRDDNGKLVASHEKFPHGMKYVADYVHKKGLKFGMYSCDGTLTCAGYPASFDYEFVDAKTFAEWGVDFLKYDNCFKPESEPGPMLYRRMGLALANCGRDILFSACNWGADESHKWIKSTGAHMWRSTGDINDSWQSVVNLYNMQKNIYEYNGQGCFNDMDMLIVGMNGGGNVANGGCTFDEYMSHFAIWCFFGSPLMIGSDIRKQTPETKGILLNKELIKLNQDAAYREPWMIKCGQGYGADAWGKILDNGDIAIMAVNVSDEKRTYIIPFTELGIDKSCGIKLEVTDLVSGESFGMLTDWVDFELDAHKTVVLRCKVKKSKK